MPTLPGQIQCPPEENLKCLPCKMQQNQTACLPKISYNPATNCMGEFVNA